jgi:serine protease Do
VRAGVRPSEETLAANLNGGDQGGADTAPDAGVAKPVLGMKLAKLTDQYRQQLNLKPATQGALIQGIRQGSDAAEKGLRPGDVIVRAGDRLIQAPADVAQAVEEARKEKRTSLALLVNHGGQAIFVPLQLAAEG